MASKNLHNDVVCSVCGLSLRSSILKCPRCNNVLVKLEGCNGSCFSCFVSKKDKCETKLN